jgi:succinate dehydrogenase / fumarate reductase cytochrome b subunit
MAMRQIKPRQNLLGAGSWLWGGTYKIERYLYILHRVTGLGLILFGILHLIETTFFRIQGQNVWESTMELLNNPVFEIGLYLVAAAFVIHVLNGARLLLQEFGFTLGKPTRPIFPYSDALRRKRPLTIVMIAVIIILLLVFLLDFVIVGGW